MSASPIDTIAADNPASSSRPRMAELHGLGADSRHLATAHALHKDNQDSVSAEELVIRPRRGWIAIDWHELYHYRELLFFLTWRDVSVRYKQTVLGVAWAVLQPVFNMVVFTVIFGNFANMPSQGVPYAVFVYAALLPWMFFSAGVGQAGQSLINQQHLLTKVYFPRLFVPAASIGGGLVDLMVSFGVYALILLWYGFMPSWGVVWVPGLVVLTICATLGFGLLLSALTVTYRDFRYVVPFLVQAMLYISPVIYPVTIVPPQYHWLIALNPMTGIIDGFRSAILGTPWNVVTLSVSSASAIGLCVLGMYYFRKTERRFADIA